MRNCTTVEVSPWLRGHTEGTNAVAHRLIPLVTPPTRNRACDSPALGSPKKSATPVRKLPEYDAEKRLPIRGLISSLIEDRHLLGPPDLLTAEQRALDKRACEVCRHLLDSNHPRKQVRGLGYWMLRLRELRKWREIEVQLAQAAIKAMTAATLARLYFQAARSKPGATPEQVSQQVAQVMQRFAASEAGEA